MSRNVIRGDGTWKAMTEDPKEHPDSRLLERFMRNETTGEDRRWIVRHLLAGCTRCGAVTRRIWNLAEERAPEPDEERLQAAAGSGPGAEGVRWQDAAPEPALVAAALHRHARRLVEDGAEEEALPALRQARRLYDRLGDLPNLLRLRHLEGKIDEALGEPLKAETAFLEARRGYFIEGMGAEAAVVLLDLAMLYTRTGRAAEVRPFAEDLLPILRDPSLRQGVAAALLFVRRLVETGHADLEVLAEVARYVNDPPRQRREAPEAPLLP
jgi:tetratricopeptide (TPR) repeat protein